MNSLATAAAQGRSWSMSFALEPLELVACSLAAIMLAIPLCFPVAAGAIAGPRRTWNWAGLAMGLALLVGILVAVGVVVAGLQALVAVAAVGMLAGLLCAIVAAVLVIVMDDGNVLAASIGTVACVLIGLGLPVDTVPAMLGISSSPLVVLASTVIGAVALVVITGFLVSAAGRARALQIGVAVAAVVAAVLTGSGVFLHLVEQVVDTPAMRLSMTTTLISVLVALVVGSIGGGVLEAVRARHAGARAEAVR